VCHARPHSCRARRDQARRQLLRARVVQRHRRTGEQRHRDPAAVLRRLRAASGHARLRGADLRLSRHRPVGEARGRDDGAVGRHRPGVDDRPPRGAGARRSTRRGRPFLRWPGAGARRQYRRTLRRRSRLYAERPLAALARRQAAAAHAGAVVAADPGSHRAHGAFPGRMDRHRRPAQERGAELGAMGPLASLCLRRRRLAVAAFQPRRRLPVALDELHRRSDRAARPRRSDSRGPTPRRRHLAPADLGTDAVGHFGFFRKSMPRAAWDALAGWLAQGIGQTGAPSKLEETPACPHPTSWPRSKTASAG
jgi:hypothetical protein